MNRNSLRISLILLAVAALAAAPAVAWGGHRGHGHGHGHGPGPGHPGMRMLGALHHLDLTDEQREQIRALLDEHHEAMEPQREAMEAAHENLRTLMQAEAFDESAVRQAAETISALHVDRIVANAALRNQIRGLLTPEQRDELQEMRERRTDGEGEPGFGMSPRRFGHGPGKRGDRDCLAE